MIDAAAIEPSTFVPCEFRVKWAATDWERRRAMALRRAVFCIEQGIFPGDDRDDIDDHAQLLVALSCIGGDFDEVLDEALDREQQVAVAVGNRRTVVAQGDAVGQDRREPPHHVRDVALVREAAARMQPRGHRLRDHPAAPTRVT